ncbi:MAG: heat-inducible transcriptional repressor HrcA [Bacilli bacterium]|nr:heat-inducible transcriptional repressor HrcA [Bacilli bacterium]
MLSKRQGELLKLIVENYIKTAKPVSSKALCKKLKCSSATVRNEMVVLEQFNLIEKTHISSGRIPSDLGYRYYVDNIMVPKELTGEDMIKLRQIFSNNALVLSDAITKSMEIVSELTNYTAVVLGKSSDDNKIAKIEVVPINDNKMIAIVITDKGHVENRNVVIDGNVSKAEVKQTIDIISKLIVGVPLNEVSNVLEFEVKPIISKYVKEHDALYSAFYNAFSDFTGKPNIKVSGTNNLLMEPEFDDASKIRSLLNKFEDKNIIKNIKAEDDEVKVYIGSENQIDDNISVIKTYYDKDGEEGTIALIGPKRMEYAKAEALLNYIKKNIGR